MADLPRLRLALTLPGGVSLGSYYGGALAALITAVQHGDGRVVVDATAAASAGSITSLLSAMALLRGVDPVPLMLGAWVEGAGLAELRDSTASSPLSRSSLESLSRRLLGPDGPPDGRPERRQAEPVRLSMSLAALAGLSYQVRNVDGRPPVLANTYQDWIDVELGPGDPRQRYQDLVIVALASGANGMGFPPVRLDRTADRTRYRDNGVAWLPDADPLQLWYTDGGTIMNEPLGRTIDLVEGAWGDDGERRLLLVMPQPPSASTSGRWWEDDPPSWFGTLPEVFKVLTVQSTYDDLRRFEKTNARLAWKERVVAAVADGLAALPPDVATQVSDAIRPRLEAALGEIEGRKAALQGREHPSAGAPRPLPGDLAGALDEAIGAATGLRTKQPIRLDVVSPIAGITDPTKVRPAGAQLAGDFLNNFGGFLDLRYRRNDYALGYENMRTWLKAEVRQLDGTGAMAAVDAAAPDASWIDESLGRATLGSASRAAKGLLLKVGWNVARAGWRQRFGPKPKPGG